MTWDAVVWKRKAFSQIIAILQVYLIKAMHIVDWTKGSQSKGTDSTPLLK